MTTEKTELKTLLLLAGYSEQVIQNIFDFYGWRA